MARTSELSLMLRNNGVPLGTAGFNVFDFQGSITASDEGNGVAEINGSGSGGGGGGQIYVQTPVGLIDGTNKTYTVANTIGEIVELEYNGEFIHPSEYTISAATFSMITALPVISGASFTVAYQGTSTIPTGTGINPQVLTPAVDGVTKIFSATGVINVIFADGQQLQSPGDYSMSYNSGTNVTTVTYVNAPQSTTYAF